eukprot:m.263624 g.263624  ORF g.263624 m.263624 type:complete len:61 (+) comp40458_c0_seq3:1708-1890(+)
MEKRLFLAAEICTFGGLAFLIMASGEVQWWAHGTNQQSKDCSRDHAYNNDTDVSLEYDSI